MDDILGLEVDSDQIKHLIHGQKDYVLVSIDESLKDDPFYRSFNPNSEVEHLCGKKNSYSDLLP